jgi:signal transduction histidine kinase
LEYSRNSRTDIACDEIDVKEMVNHIFEDLKYSTSDKMQFEMHTQGTCTLISDRQRVNILLRNIIGNAVKYARKDDQIPFVQVHLKGDANQMCMEVRDNGEGISEKSLPRIFDMFYRGTSTATGTGLGLFICKEITNKLKGDIRIESTKSVGTSVFVLLPNQTKREE